MKTIEKITIKGFQSHTNSVISVSPGLTVITGPSDSGKTAIIRAIRWVAFGEPAGDSFVNQAVGQAEVNIHLANGTIVTKRRKGTKTSYMLEVPGSEPMIFDKAETPEEIIQALGIVKTQFGDFEAELNFAYQLAAPFLLSEPPSAGAKVLGKLSGTEVVDMAIKAVAKDNYAANQARLQAVKDIDKTEAALMLFDDLPQQQEQLQACGILLNRVDLNAAKHKTFTELQAAYSSTAEKIAGHNETLQRFVNVPKLQEDLKGTDGRFSTLEVLRDVLKKYKDNRQQIAEWQKRLKHYGFLLDATERLQNIGYSLLKCKSLRGITDLHETYAQQIKTANSVIEATGDLQGAGNILNNVELLHVAYLERLQKLRWFQQCYAKDIKRFTDLIESTAGVPAASSKLQNTEANIECLQQLQLLKTQHNLACSQITRYVKMISDTARLKQAAETIASIAEKRNKVAMLRDLCNLHNSRENQVSGANISLKVNIESADKAKNELHDLWNSVGACPLCGRVITGEVCC